MNTEKIFNAVFRALFVLMFLMRFWFAFRVWRMGERLRSDRAARQRMGFWASLTDQLFFIALAAVLVHLWLFGGNLRTFAFPAPDWLRWASCALGTTSVGLFAWAHTILRRFWSSHLQLRPSHQLITVGPYARIRHPIYTAIVGWLISLGLVAANWTSFVFAALAALHFLLKIQGEEKMMLPRPGAFFTIWFDSHPCIADRIEFCNTYHPWETRQLSKYEKYFPPAEGSAGPSLSSGSK